MFMNGMETTVSVIEGIQGQHNFRAHVEPGKSYNLCMDTNLAHKEYCLDRHFKETDSFI